VRLAGPHDPLIALGNEAARHGFHVRYVLATELVNELVEAADDKQLPKTIVRYGRVNLLTFIVALGGRGRLGQAGSHGSCSW
jgi:hypothetical protein